MTKESAATDQNKNDLSDISFAQCWPSVAVDDQRWRSALVIERCQIFEDGHRFVFLVKAIFLDPFPFACISKDFANGIASFLFDDHVGWGFGIHIVMISAGESRRANH